jgi:zinc D-Ala-D-Ala carboxypeptidase
MDAADTVLSWECGLPGRHRRRRSVPLAFAFALVVITAAVSPVAAATFTIIPPPPPTGTPPACEIGNTTTQLTSYDDWASTLVDWNLRVASSYAPKDLVPVGRAGIAGRGQVRSFVIPDLAALTRAARAAGAPIAVEGAYRSYNTQVSTFNGWVAQLGYDNALLGSARAGHSEHQLGTAIDFKTAGGGDPWHLNGFDWATTAAGAWMMKNAWKYGFILSYPSGKANQVCYGYEPWHYRYFGRATAAAIHASGQTTRVWLWQQEHIERPAFVRAGHLRSPL